jgi:predicted O-methyltransferase YrrM
MTSHRITLVQLLKKHQWKTGAELGVDEGILSRMLLDASPELQLIGVDNFTLNPQFRAQVDAMAEEYAPRYRVIAMNTDEASALVDDRSLDFVFIDANHSEERTYEDIQHWRSKVKPGGWFGGDAYNPKWYPQVLTAVHRVYAKSQVHVLPGRVWGVWA